MASANRHRRAQYWFQTVICRIMDVGVMNTRAICKTLGREYSMVDLKRILAHGLAKLAVRAEYCDDLPALYEQFGSKKIKISGAEGRLDGKLHFWNSSGKVRRKCRVHQSFRCETNKYCINCQAYLCDGQAWAQWHTEEKYIL